MDTVPILNRRYPRFLVGWLLVAFSGVIGAFADDWHEWEGKLVGVVEALPASGLVGDWRVAGVVVHVLPSTRIKQEHGFVQVGSIVKMEGSWQPDRSFTAYEISVEVNPGGVPPASDTKIFGVLKLLPTPEAPAGAEGVVIVRSFSVGGTVVREDLKVGVEHLLPQQTYDVFVDGVHAGTMLTNYQGEGYLFLSSQPPPGAEPLPPQLSPVTQRQRAEVRQGGVVMLAGDFAAARWDGDWFAGGQYLAVAPLANRERVVVGLGVAEVKENEQKLKVVAFLSPQVAEVRVLVDGLELGTLTTLPNGMLHVTFSTRPDEEDLPLPEDALPVSGWQEVTLQTLEGEVLASGSLLAAPLPGTATAPGQVRRHLGKPRS